MMIEKDGAQESWNKAVYTSQSRVRVGRGSDEIDQLDGLATLPRFVRFWYLDALKQKTSFAWNWRFTPWFFAYFLAQELLKGENVSCEVLCKLIIIQCQQEQKNKGTAVVHKSMKS